MFKQLFIFLFVIALGFTTIAPQAHAVDATAALKRIDAIIAEMQSLRAEFAALTASAVVSTPAPVVQGAVSGGILGDDLAFGSTNDDIKKIQRLLATDAAIYPYGVASGFFGPKTQEAIRMFQSRFGLDTVGVVGPSTRALLEVFFASYPSENYPVDILKQAKPTAKPVATAQTTAPASTPSTAGAKEINVTVEDDESLIEIVFSDGNRKGYVADTEDEDEVIAFIVRKTSLTVAQVTAAIDFEKKRSSSSRDDNNEDDAEDAMDDAEEAIDEADDEIDDADEDGDDVDWAEDTLDDAKDLLDDAEKAYDDEEYDESVELAEEAEEMAKKAEDRIDEEKGDDQGDSDDIDSIEADVDEGKTSVVVEYDDGNEYEFSVDEDKMDSIVEEVADELDMDEDDVEDLIEFDFGRVSKIDVEIRSDNSLAFVEYRSGVERRVRMSQTDEDDIIEELAYVLDEEEDEVEDWTSFD